MRLPPLFGDPKLDAIIAKHWGQLQSSTREEKLAEVRRLNNDLRASEGNSLLGKEVFNKHCAACHQLKRDALASVRLLPREPGASASVPLTIMVVTLV